MYRSVSSSPFTVVSPNRLFPSPRAYTTDVESYSVGMRPVAAPTSFVYKKVRVRVWVCDDDTGLCQGLKRPEGLNYRARKGRNRWNEFSFFLFLFGSFGGGKSGWFLFDFWAKQKNSEKGLKFDSLYRVSHTPDKRSERSGW